MTTCTANNIHGSGRPGGRHLHVPYDLVLAFQGEYDYPSMTLNDASFIQYPFALDSNRRLVHISDVSRAESYYCPHCRARFTPRLGQIRARHYAHRTDAEECGPDSILHTTAIRLIAQTFDSKKAADEDYWLHYTCPEGHPREVSLTKWFDEARIEHSMIESTRSDVALLSERTRAAIEVVVTHDIEESTLERYKSNSIPIFKITPTFDSLEQLVVSYRSYDG